MSNAYNSIYNKSGTVKYTDLDLSFLSNPFNGDFRKKTGIDAIKQSIKNILFTKQGEKPFNPSFGGRIYHLLFEPLDSVTELQLRQGIASSLSQYEPRIVLLDLQISEIGQEITIQITFTLRTIFEPQILSHTINRLK